MLADQRASRNRLGALSPRYAFVLNPHVRERFSRCPSCAARTRVRKLPLVVHVEHLDGPRLLLLNKTCRLCVVCETLVVDQSALDHVIIATGLSAVATPRYVVLGTLDRRVWRRGLDGDAQLADIRAHMADFRRYLRVDVTPAHWALPNEGAG